MLSLLGAPLTSDTYTQGLASLGRMVLQPFLFTKGNRKGLYVPFGTKLYMRDHIWK